MGKKKGSESSAAPASTFSGGFGLGSGPAGEDKAVKATGSSTTTEVAKKTSDKNAEEENEEEEDGEDEEDDGEFNLKDLIDLSSLPKDVRKRVAVLRKIQDDYNVIDEEYKKARIELERSFLQRKTALYEARRAIAVGEVEVPDLPPAEGEEAETEPANAEPEEPTTGIPSFWAQVLNSHPQIGGYIVEDDLPALEALTDIKCTYDEEFKSFTLYFHFAENDYFTNTVLTKTYHVTPDLLDDKAPSLKNTEGCEISWKEGKNLCVEETVKKQRAKSGRNKGQIRTIKVTKPKQSFFQFFSPQSEDDEDEGDDEKEGKEDEDDVKIHPEDDYDIGHAIRTSIIPEAVLWYTGEAALQYDYMYGGDEDDDDEEDDEDGDEEDDDEDEEEEEEKPPTKKKTSKPVVAGTFAPASGAAATGADGEKPAECKQN